MTPRCLLVVFLFGLAALLRAGEEAAAAPAEPKDAAPAAQAGEAVAGAEAPAQEAESEAKEAEEEAAKDPLRPWVSLDMGLYGKYIWRLMNYNSHPVLQPDLKAGVYGFSAEIWGVRDLTKDDRDATGNLIELDWKLSYEREFALDRIGLEDAACTVEAGIWSYNYPNTNASSTHELFVETSFVPPVIGQYLAPGVGIYYDIEDARDALWVEARLEGGVELPKPKCKCPVYADGVEWTLFTGLSNRAYNRFNFADASGVPLNESACVGGGIQLTLPCKIKGADFLTIAPSAQVTTIWDSDARDMSDHPDNFMWGLTVAVGF